MLRYWRETLNGLETLAWDAFDAVCVTAGEWALKRWDKQHPNAHDIDMAEDIADFDRAMAEDDGEHIRLADLLAEAEADQEVWEPLEPPCLYMVMGKLVYAAEMIAEAAEDIEKYVNHQEKQS